MTSTPFLTARLTEPAARAWQAICLPKSCAISTAVAISSSIITVISALQWVTNSSPEMLILRLSTPSRMQVRQVRRISSTPSTTSAKLSR